MKALQPIIRLWCHFYFSTALRQLSSRNPLHPDIPGLVHAVNHYRKP